MSLNYSYLQIKPAEGSDFNEKTFQKFLLSALKLLRGKKNNWLSFELVFRNHNLNFYIVCHRSILPVIKSQIYNFFTGSNIEETSDPLGGLEKKSLLLILLRYQRNIRLRMKTYLHLLLLALFLILKRIN